MTCTELAARYERGEITFDEFMNADTTPEKFVVRNSKKRGCKAAAAQGALVTPAQVSQLPEEKELSVPLESIQPSALSTRNGGSSPQHEQPETAPLVGTGGGLQNSLADEQGPFVAAPSNLKTAEAALKFILAGNAYFTVRSQKTGTRYTFRVSKAKDDQNSQQFHGNRYVDTYFVALLTGPENTSDYSYLGMIRENRFRLTRASKMQETSTPVKAFRWVFEHLVRRELPPQTEIWHEGRCGRCGRMLTVPESVQAGIGPECAGRMGL